MRMRTQKPHQRLGRRAVGLGTLLLTAVVLFGQARCIWGTDKDYLADGELASLQVNGSNPEADETGVSRAGRLVLQLSDRVRPESLGDGALRLLEGGSEVAAATHVDLIRCEVSVASASPLESDTEYTFEAEGLMGFDGGELDEVFSVTFVTGQDASTIGPPPAPSFSEVYTTIIAPRCAACHTDFRAPGGLDLSNPTAAQEGLLGGHSQYAVGAPRFVVPGNHAASYLMHKVLGLPGIWGDPMPLAGDWPTDRDCGSLDAELRLLADWIDSL